MWLHRAGAVAVLSALALGSATGRSDDASRPPPGAPGAGLLEFLGSVDRLSEVNPNYLAQPDPPRTAPRTATAAPGAPVKPPPPPPAQPPAQQPPPEKQ
jgi:hypothetical protein